MTHRTALALSVALTLVLGAGVLIGRDRLFAAETTPGPAAAIRLSAAPIIGDGAMLAENGPRVVEVPLPAAIDSEDARERGYEFERDSDEDDDWDDHDDGDDDERHDDEDEDDEDDDD